MGPLAALGLPGVGTAIEAGSSIFNQTIGMIAQERNRKLNLRQYHRQREHNLADWNMQNAYDAPKAQMERYKEAGLNPNLIYGQMTSSPAIKSADSPSANATPPEFKAGSVLDRYYDTKIKSGQLDLLQKQIETQSNEADLKAAQTVLANKQVENLDSTITGRNWGTQRSQSLFKYDQTYKAQETELQRKKMGMLTIQGQYIIDKNAREQEMQQPNLALAAARTLDSIESAALKRAYAETQPYQRAYLTSVINKNAAQARRELQSLDFEAYQQEREKSFNEYGISSKDGGGLISGIVSGLGGIAVKALSNYAGTGDKSVLEKVDHKVEIGPKGKTETKQNTRTIKRKPYKK